MIDVCTKRAVQVPLNHHKLPRDFVDGLIDSLRHDKEQSAVGNAALIGVHLEIEGAGKFTVDEILDAGKAALETISLARSKLRLATLGGDVVDEGQLMDVPTEDGFTLAEKPPAKAANRAAMGAEEPIRLWTLAELAEASKGARWLCKGIIPAESLTMFFGASETFKSFVAVDLALHVAHGLRWLNRKTERCPVLYLAAEGGAGLSMRVASWHKARGRDISDAAFRVVTIPIDLALTASNLRCAMDEACFAPGLIVIDTMSQTYRGEENSANEVAEWLAVVGKELRAAMRATVLVIHHSGHSNTERPRGSSALIANVDALYGFVRDDKEMLCTMETYKAKDSERPPSQQFSLAVHQLGNDEDGDPVTSLVASHVATAADVVAVVKREAVKGRGKNRSSLLELAEHGQMEVFVRSEFLKRLDEDMPLDAKRQAWHKAKHWAIGAGIFEIVDGKIYRRD